MSDLKANIVSKARGAIKLDAATYRRIKLLQAAFFETTSEHLTMSEIMAQALNALDSAGASNRPVPVESLENAFGASKKELAIIGQLLVFLRTAHKDDVHYVLSLLARHAEILPEPKASSTERKARGR